MTRVPLRPADRAAIAARLRAEAAAIRRTAGLVWISDRPEEAGDAIAYRDALLARAAAKEEEARRWET